MLRIFYVAGDAWRLEVHLSLLVIYEKGSLRISFFVWNIGEICNLPLCLLSIKAEGDEGTGA